MAEVEWDRLYDALGFEPLRQDAKGNDIGQCFDPYGWHKHGDRSGKLICYQENERFACFVCGSFTLPKLASLVRNCTEEEADEWLDEYRIGLEQSDDGFRKAIRDKLNYKYTQKEEELPKFVPGVFERFQSYENWPQIALDWADNRGLTESTIKEFNIRFGNVRRLPPKDLKEDPHYGPAILLPHYWHGDFIGWQYRWLGNRPYWLQKYTNTQAFGRSKTIYNYDRAAREELPVYVVESVTTVLWLAELGFSSVATFGSKISDAQLKALRSFQQGLILAPDNDNASIEWMNRLSLLDKYVPLRQIKRVQIKHENDASDLGSLAPDKQKTYEALSSIIN